ncbi:MAG: DUF4230 domain-containing protein [Bacteroidetes bacterium]|nr:DUF4230 domain-containing protein [Bacteroidota bacterium]
MIKNNRKFIIAFCMGAVAVLLLFFMLKKIFHFWDKKELNDAYIITNQITKMNKMVVVEQDFSALRKSKVSYEFLGKTISENAIVTFTKTNVQVSYDLNKMKMEVDSINKKLIIKSIPKPDIRINPNVEIQSMDDSFFNRIDEAQIKKVTQEAKSQAIAKVDKAQLEKESQKQLMENLNQIFVLAKSLHYEIVDETHSLDFSTLLD